MFQDFFYNRFLVMFSSPKLFSINTQCDTTEISISFRWNRGLEGNAFPMEEGVKGIQIDERSMEHKFPNIFNHN